MHSIKTYQSEPISKFVIDKLGIRGKVRLLIYCIIFGGISIGISALEGTLIYEESPSKISYFDDFSTFIDFLILNPLVLFLMQSYFLRFNEIIESLDEKGIIDCKTTSVQREIAKMNSYFSKPYSIVLPLTIAIVAMIIHTVNISGYKGYFIFDSTYYMSYSGVYIILLTTIYVYFLLFSLQKIYFLARIKKALFNQKVRIQLLHEDRCGGLKKVGDLCMTLNYCLFLIAVTLLLFVVADKVVFNDLFSFRVLLVMPLYFFGAPYLFFLPLIPIHKKMEEERSKHLSAIGLKFEDSFNQFRKSDDHLEQDRYLSGMRNLQEIFTWIEEIPKWPIDTRTYVKFTATIIFPLIAFIVQLIMSLNDIQVSYRLLKDFINY